MNKLLLIFSICTLAVSAAFSQDDVYYTGDEASVSVKAQTAPPAMPTYVQPACPNDGYMWTPGYWAWGPMGYYWVPGVWVAPPYAGLLWTPGYWGFYNGYYGWHGGYWGNSIGYYGGVNYGYGYGGSGFYGGRWAGGSFQYNTAVWSVNSGVIHNTYSSNVGVSANVSSTASYNGPGGVQAHPMPSEQAAMAQPHVQPTSEQQSHQVAASNDKNQLASVNNGKPATTAMATPNGQKFGAQGHAVSGSAVGAGHPANTTTNSKPASESTSKPVSESTNKPAEKATNGNTQQSSGNNSQKHSSKAPAPAKHAPAPQHSNGGGGGGKRGK